MSEDVQGNSELFDEATTTSELSSEVKVPEEQESSEEIKHTAEDNRQKQINTFLNRVKSGEMTVDDIPHKWIQNAVKEQMKPEPKESVEEIVQKALKSERDKAEYADLRAKLNEADLTEAKKAKVSAEYQELIESGMPQAKALKKAIAYAGVKLESDRFAARLPKVSNAKPDSVDYLKEKLQSGESIAEIPLDKRVDYWESLRKAPIR